MVVSKANTLLVTRITKLQKQQVKMEQYSRRGETMLRYLVSLMKYQTKI